jgi:hypothetical protein
MRLKNKMVTIRLNLQSKQFFLGPKSPYKSLRNRARIFELLLSTSIDSKESIPPADVAWRAGTTTLFPLGS